MAHEENGNVTLYVHPAIYVKRCEYGFGIFAREFIAKDSMLEECHFIRYKRDECQSLKINDYVYELADPPDAADDDKGCNALVLGFGSIYNHSFENNAHYLFDSVKNVFVYQATRDIHPGEQIFISYGENWWNTRENRLPDATSPCPDP